MKSISSKMDIVVCMLKYTGQTLARLFVVIHDENPLAISIHDILLSVRLVIHSSVPITDPVAPSTCKKHGSVMCYGSRWGCATSRTPHAREEWGPTGTYVGQVRICFGESVPSYPNRSTGHVWSEGRAGGGTDAQEPSLRNS